MSPGEAGVLAVSVLLRDDLGRVLLVERGRGDNRGRWSLPGGRVEPGETLAAAGAREVAEETALRIEVGAEVDVLAVPAPEGDARGTYEVHVLRGQVIAGVATAGDDAAAVRWCAGDEWNRLPLTDGLAALLAEHGT